MGLEYYKCLKVDVGYCGDCGLQPRVTRLPSPLLLGFLRESHVQWPSMPNVVTFLWQPFALPDQLPSVEAVLTLCVHFSWQEGRRETLGNFTVKNSLVMFVRPISSRCISFLFSSYYLQIAPLEVQSRNSFKCYLISFILVIFLYHYSFVSVLYLCIINYYCVSVYTTVQIFKIHLYIQFFTRF